MSYSDLRHDELDFIFRKGGAMSVWIVKILLTEDIDTKFNRWTLLSYVIACGGDDDYEFVRRLLLRGPSLGKYQIKDGQMLLNMVENNSRWRYRHWDLVRLLKHHGEHKMLKIANSNREKSYIVLGIRVQSHEYLDPHFMGKMSLQWSRRLMTFYPIVPNENIYTPLKEKEKWTKLLHFTLSKGGLVQSLDFTRLRLFLERGGITGWDEFGFQVDWWLRPKMTLEQYHRLLDEGMSPWTGEGSLLDEIAICGDNISETYPLIRRIFLIDPTVLTITHVMKLIGTLPELGDMLEVLTHVDADQSLLSVWSTFAEQVKTVNVRNLNLIRKITQRIAPTRIEVTKHAPYVAELAKVLKDMNLYVRR